MGGRKDGRKGKRKKGKEGKKGNREDGRRRKKGEGTIRVSEDMIRGIKGDDGG